MYILLERTNDFPNEPRFSVQELDGELWSGWHHTAAEAVAIGPVYEETGGYTSLSAAIAAPDLKVLKVYHDDQTYSVAEFKQLYPEYFI